MTTDVSPASQRAILSAEERAMIAAYMEQQTYIPFTFAADLTGLPAVLLRKLVRDGVIEGDAPWRTKGVVGTCNIDQARAVAERLEAARAPVEGVGISAYTAAEKYQFDVTTIYKWHKNKWVNAVSSSPTLFDEGDIAFARALADLSGQTAGKSVFPAKPRSGRPRKRD